MSSDRTGQYSRAGIRNHLWHSLGIAALYALLIAPSTPAAERKTGDTPQTDLEIKAAFVVNFVRLVNWSTLADYPARSQIEICGLSRTEFFVAVRDAALNKTVGNKPLGVKIVPAVDRSQCRVFIADGSEYGSIRSMLESLRDAPVLTVGNGAGFLVCGGMFELDVWDRRVQFDINPDAIRSSGLDISGRLLPLSRSFGKAKRNGS